jgi:hypothetical protein
MSKLILMAFSFLSTSVFAMPEGSLDCKSVNSATTSISVSVSNYGEHVANGVLEFTLYDEPLDLTKNKVSISRQWIDEKVANLDLVLPHVADQGYKNVVIETTSLGHDTMGYVGKLKVETMDEDYASPVKVIDTQDIQCVYNQ